MMYGPSGLFMFVLFLNVRFDLRNFLYNVHLVALLTYDVKLYLDIFAESLDIFPEGTLYDLLGISAHPKLKKYCLKFSTPKLVKRAKSLTTVPKLLELARNKAENTL